ncbi:hypothetical protein K474DRAFT_1593400 [Panus rudis PR-1116 ss-1]|nr:hypothetical protein K474DRAFT_1593400 [Panus rudis PR-1116 ss-1]
MPVPEALSKWLIQRYPKPKIDAEWLEACYNWVIETKNLDPITDIAEIQTQVNQQLLCSDFSLSMVPATGLTANIKALKNTILRGPPILLELISLEEIGHSAFSLSNVRQIRIDREDLAGLGNSDEEGQDDDEGPIPRYPRSLLKMVLSDGHRQLVAIEDTRIEGLELGKTSLGCKVSAR